MAKVHDVAAFILAERGPLSAVKLQKLVYYSQAWSLVWDGKPLFSERIEAWANGPVVRELYDAHKGRFEIATIAEGDASALNAEQKDTVRQVLAFYGDRSPQWLSDLTHMERPWRLARAGVPEGDRSNNEITLESMSEYYSSLPPPTPPG